ncbi:hypothetical protein [Streptomyces longisporoflavus]|uniref:Uncharacterized protein n=1 Tax=Streptomyces longisporoflavus TaxID=28044 RepID=A0ABW7QZL6_9ACTN
MPGPWARAGFFQLARSLGDVHAVGERHREQREIGRHGHDLAARRDVDQAEESVADERATGKEQEGGGKRRTGCEAGQQRCDEQCDSEDDDEHHGRNSPISEETGLKTPTRLPGTSTGTLHVLDAASTDS